jgi:heat shock protein HslJ
VIRPAAFAALVLTVAACNLDPKREPPPKPFTGTKWLLQLEVPGEGEAPFLQFGDGHVSGYTGCNRLNGRYQQDAVGAGAIVFTQVAITKRGCEPRVMTIEARILEVLGSSTSVGVLADTMRIDGSAGKLEFRAAPVPVPVPATAPAK